MHDNQACCPHTHVMSAATSLVPKKKNASKITTSVDNSGAPASPSSTCSSCSASSFSSESSSSSLASLDNSIAVVKTKSEKKINKDTSNNTNKIVETQEEKEARESQKREFAIPRIHIKRLIKEFIQKKVESSARSDNNQEEQTSPSLIHSYKMTPKAIKLIHLHTDAFVSEIFSLSRDVLKLTGTKTLKCDAIKLCVRWKLRSMLRFMQNQQW